MSLYSTQQDLSLQDLSLQDLSLQWLLQHVVYCSCDLANKSYDCLVYAGSTAALLQRLLALYASVTVARLH